MMLFALQKIFDSIFTSFLFYFQLADLSYNQLPPAILENKFLEFINDVNSKINSPLQCFKLKNGKDTDLYDTIEQVIKG